MRFLLLLIFAASLWAQSLSLSGPAKVRPGEPLILSAGFASGAVEVAGVQWTLTPSSSSVILGIAGTSANKELFCNASVCLVVGLNSTIISSGELARFSFAAPSQPGLLSLTLSSIGVSPAANPVPIAGSSLVIQILTREDLNGDGKVDGVDLLILANQALGVSPCTNGDLNSDGKCDLIDAQILANARTQV